MKKFTLKELRERADRSQAALTKQEDVETKDRIEKFLRLSIILDGLFDSAERVYKDAKLVDILKKYTRNATPENAADVPKGPNLGTGGKRIRAAGVGGKRRRAVYKDCYKHPDGTIYWAGNGKRPSKFNVFVQNGTYESLRVKDAVWEVKNADVTDDPGSVVPGVDPSGDSLRHNDQKDAGGLAL